MPELRLTLLIIGVLFVIAVAWWERRRPHQASRQSPHIGADTRPLVKEDPTWGSDVGSSGARPGREPTLTLPEIRSAEAHLLEPVVAEDLTPAETSQREPAVRELPMVEIDDSLIGLRVDGEPVEEGIVMDAQRDMDEPAEQEAIVPLVESPSAVEPTQAQAPQLPPAPAHPTAPIVEWPAEEQRKLLSLRLVARPSDRFRGNLLRQALAAEGFVLGDLDIFHKPDAANVTVLSAASLTKPGSFDLQVMDTQRFVGLNLFAVLPGPRSPQRTFEDLLATARLLNERLEGALQDERGDPLTPTRIQAIRDSLGAEA